MRFHIKTTKCRLVLLGTIHMFALSTTGVGRDHRILFDPRCIFASSKFLSLLLCYAPHFFCENCHLVGEELRISTFHNKSLSLFYFHSFLPHIPKFILQLYKRQMYNNMLVKISDWVKIDHK